MATDRHKEEKAQIIREWCGISYWIMCKVFDAHIPADCFCNKRDKELAAMNTDVRLLRFEYNPLIFDYVREAVQEKLDREGKRLSFHGFDD